MIAVLNLKKWSSRTNSVEHSSKVSSLALRHQHPLRNELEGGVHLQALSSFWGSDMPKLQGENEPKGGLPHTEINNENAPQTTNTY